MRLLVSRLDIWINGRREEIDEIVKLFVQTLKTLKDENKSLTTTINDWELTWNAVNSEGESYDFRYDIENGYTRISAKNNKTDEVKNLHYNLETEKLEVKNDRQVTTRSNY